MGHHVCAFPDFSLVRGERILIALSGGSDSVALTHMLWDVRSRYDLTLFAAHLDHGIRCDSRDDVLFCQNYCAELDIELITTRFEVPSEALRLGEGIETTARRLRHAWLTSVADELRVDRIALAHHMDDQAETVLMHLSRGTGPEGVCGMRPFSGRLYRPLLCMRKAQIIDYLEKHDLCWRDDATNGIDDTPRNAIRIHVIPELERCYNKAVEAISRFTISAQIESDFLSEETQRFIEDRLLIGPFGKRLDIRQEVADALLRRAIRVITDNRIDWEDLNDICVLCKRQKGVLNVSGGLRFERCGHFIYLLQDNLPVKSEIPLSLDGGTELGQICHIDAKPSCAVPIRSDPFRQVLNADALNGAVLRTRRPGDRFRPLGCGDRLLSDYFTDRKLDRPLRDHIALVACGSRVLWVCGMGISEDVKLNSVDDHAVLLDCRYDAAMKTALSD